MELEKTDEILKFEEEIGNDLGVQPEDLAQKEVEPAETLHQKRPNQKGNSRSSFFDGLAVGSGIGCIIIFATIWVSLFLSPMLPQTATYESLLAAFIYLLIFTVGTGLVAVTAGVVREYYSKTTL